MRTSHNRENKAGANRSRGAEGAAPGCSDQFDVEDGIRSKLKEQDPHRLAQRQKALDKGKNTRAYQNYLQRVPKKQRQRKNEEEYPNTPDKYEICSTRAWLGKVRHWRLRLHKWDPAPQDGEEEVEVPTRKFPGIKKDPTPQGAKRPRDSEVQPQQHKRQSISSLASVREGSTVSGSAVSGRTEQDAASSEQPQAANRSIFDDWDEEDIAL